MTALGDALASSQAKAVAALGKAYIRRDEAPDDELFAALLRKIGCDDDVQIAFLLSAWAVLREEKAAAPTEAKPVQDERPASDAQWNRIRRDCKAAGVEPPQGPLTMRQASETIEHLAAGTYEPVPF